MENISCALIVIVCSYCTVGGSHNIQEGSFDLAHAYTVILKTKVCCCCYLEGAFLVCCGSLCPYLYTS